MEDSLMEPKPDSLFGAVAVLEGFASEAEVEVALEAQKDVAGANPRIGQILLEMGALNQAQIEAVLDTQSRFRSASGVPERLPQESAAAQPLSPDSHPRFVQESGEPPQVNDEIVREPRLLAPGDRLVIAGARFRFEGNAGAAPLLVPAASSKPAEPATPAEAPPAPVETVPSTAAESAPSEPVLSILDRMASRLLPRVHNHRKYLVALAALGLLAIVLPWRIAKNGNTVIGLQGPGWLTFWLLGVSAGGAALTRVARPIGKVEWIVIASSSGLAFLSGVWKFALPPVWASGRGVGLYLTLVSAALVHGVCWLIRGSSSPAVAEDGAAEPAALKLARWANRIFRDMTGKSAQEKAAQIQKRDDLLQEIGRAALAAKVVGLEADLARDAAAKFAAAEAAAGADLKARAMLKAAEGKAKRALGKLGRSAIEKGVALPEAETKLAELRALEEKIGEGK
jgi:hypothetical protein